MSKNSKKNSNKYPFVSVCTPTFNRRPFIENMFQCFRNQNYPKSRIEWIIVDDGTDKIKDLVEKSNIPQIRYFEVAEKMKLGAKRNYMHSFAKGSIIVYMDDDDYYPPDRISHAVERLQSKPEALCAGSSEIYIYFKSLNKMYQCGPYNANHATAGTFAFRKELLEKTKYEDSASLAEERAFLKDYTIPFVQLDPMKSILVFSHDHNTFDKKKMLDSPHPDYMKESPKTVDLFIKESFENSIKNFFMNDIDKLLANYEPGLPKMKPDVLIQMKQIEEERQKFMKEQMEKQQNASPIILQRPGEEPIQLSNNDIVNIMKQQQDMIQQLQQQLQEKTKVSNQPDLLKHVNELELKITNLMKQVFEKSKTIKVLTDEIKTLKSNKNQGTEQSNLPTKPSTIDNSTVEPLNTKSKTVPLMVFDVSD
jgi:glycosyltransferase involved in cell wall biosynthesis